MCVNCVSAKSFLKIAVLVVAEGLWALAEIPARNIDWR